MVSPRPSIRPLLVRISGRGLLGVVEDSEAHLVQALAAHVMLEPGDRFEVVVEHLGPGFEHDVDQVGPTVEVRGEHLDRGAGSAANGQDALPKVLGAAVRQVVARDGGDHDVPQAQALTGFGEAFGLVDRDRLGVSALDGAEAAGPGAHVAQDHECRRPAGPALRAIGAPRTFADSFEAELVDQASRERHAPRGRDRPLEPFRQPAPRAAVLLGIPIEIGRRGHARPGQSGSACRACHPGLGA